MKLMPGENVLWETSSDAEKITLTDRRIRKHVKSTGSQEVTGIFLEHVTSCRQEYISHPFLIVFAIVAAVGGIIALARGMDAMGVFLMVLGVVFIVLYFTTRFNQLAFASPSGKITYRIFGNKVDDATEIIEEVEEAIHYRRLTMSQIVQAQSEVIRLPVGL